MEEQHTFWTMKWTSIEPTKQPIVNHHQLVSTFINYHHLHPYGLNNTPQHQQFKNSRRWDRCSLRPDDHLLCAAEGSSRSAGRLGCATLGRPPEGHWSVGHDGGGVLVRCWWIWGITWLTFHGTNGSWLCWCFTVFLGCFDWLVGKFAGGSWPRATQITWLIAGSLVGWIVCSCSAVWSAVAVHSVGVAVP